MGRILTIFVLFIAAWIVFGPFGHAPAGAATDTTLATLLADPAAWEGRQVAVTGQVRDRANVLGLGGIVIGDAAGNSVTAIGWVDPAAPGETLTVRGEFRTAVALGQLQVPVILITPPAAR